MEWSAILALMELLFVLPVSNPKVEAFFSLMKRAKTDARASLKGHRLNSLLRIVTEGPPTNEFIPTTAIDLWVRGCFTARRPNQSYRSYKPREKKKIAETLIFFLFSFATRAGSPQQREPLTVGPYYLTHPVNFPCGRKPEYPEKTHDFRQSVDYTFFT